MSSDPTHTDVHHFTTPGGEFVEVSRFPNGGAWQAVYWSTFADWSADQRERGEWSDRATVSVVVDTHADIVRELGDGATPTNPFVELLLDRLPNASGHLGRVECTGGNCYAVVISYGAAGEVLVTDGDAGLPSWGSLVVVGDYPTDDDDGRVVAELRSPSPEDVAERVGHYLNSGDVVLPSGNTVSGDTWAGMCRAGGREGWLDGRMYSQADRDYMDALLAR